MHSRLVPMFLTNIFLNIYLFKENASQINIFDKDESFLILT